MDCTYSLILLRVKIAFQVFNCLNNNIISALAYIEEQSNLEIHKENVINGIILINQYVSDYKTPKKICPFFKFQDFFQT